MEVVLLDTIGRRNRRIPDKACECCGKIFRPIDSKKRACSIQCGMKIRRNPNEGRKKDEVWWVDKKGYIQGRIRINDVTINVRQHRYVMEKHIGRKLEVWEDVHHIDENKQNNDISNLRIIAHGSHSTLHNNKRVYKRGYKMNLSEEERNKRSDRMKKMRTSK